MGQSLAAQRATTLDLDLQGLELPEHAKRDLEAMRIIRPDFAWFSEANLSVALETFESLRTAVAHCRWEVFRLCLSALVQLYHRDRAERASFAIPGNPVPILTIPLTKELPALPPPPAALRELGLPTFGFFPRVGVLVLSKPEQWTADIPTSVLSNFNKVIRSGMPDGLSLAEYKSIPDPVLYASYGPWYVAIGEWE